MVLTLSYGIPGYIMVLCRRTAAVLCIYPMRIDVRRRVYAVEKGWGQFMTRTRSYAPDCIYLYLSGIIGDYIPRLACQLWNTSI